MRDNRKLYNPYKNKHHNIIKRKSLISSICFYSTGLLKGILIGYMLGKKLAK